MSTSPETLQKQLWWNKKSRGKILCCKVKAVKEDFADFTEEVFLVKNGESVKSGVRSKEQGRGLGGNKNILQKGRGKK